MACKKLTKSELLALLDQNPNAEGYPTLDDCEGPCAGPATCSADWGTATTIELPGFSKGVSSEEFQTGKYFITSAPGSLILQICIERSFTSEPEGWNPSWGQPELIRVVVVNANCQYPPTYEPPDGGGFGAIFNSRTQCYLSTNGQFRGGSLKYIDFQVVLGPDGLPTRIKDISYQEKYTTPASSNVIFYDCDPPSVPEITFGRP